MRTALTVAALVYIANNMSEPPLLVGLGLVSLIFLAFAQDIAYFKNPLQ